MNRHYLREHDFEPDAGGVDADELPPPNPPDAFEPDPEPSLDISPEMKRAVMIVGVPLAFAFAIICWYGVYRLGKFLYDLAANA